MRSKRFPALVALAIGMLLAFAPGAGAQEGEGEDVEELIEHVEHFMHDELDAEHADQECAVILLEGGTVDDCRDAPNPLLPETNEIIWGAIGFVVVFGFLAWKGMPAIKKAMADRTEKIQGDIDAAETTKAEAEQVKATYEASLADAKAESARIIEEARQAADQLKADQQTRLNEELATMRAQAQADIDQAKSQAMAELQNEVTSIAVGAAEQVVGANLDREAQARLVEEYINQVATSGQAPSGQN